MKVAWDRREEFYILGRTKNPSGTSQRPVGGTGESTGMIGESQLGLAFGFTVCRCQPFVVAMTCSIVGKGCGKGPVGKGSGFTWTHGMLCVCAHHPASGTSWGRTGRMASSFSSSLGRSPFALTKGVQLKPFVLAETLKACALIGLHLVAAGGESGSSSSCGGLFAGAGRDSRGQWSEESSVERSKLRVLWVMRCSSATLSGGLLKSSGRIGQARWWRSFSRIGSLGE